MNYSWKHWISIPANKQLFEQSPARAVRMFNEELFRRQQQAEFFHAIYGGGASQEESQINFSFPQGPSDTYLDISAAKYSTLFLETSAGSVPRTDITASGAEVGFIQDLGTNALFGRAITNLVRPTVESTVSLNAALNFDGVRPIVFDSQKGAFNFLHGDDEIFSVQIRGQMGPSSNGSNVTILSTNEFGNSATTGITIWKNVSNTISVSSAKGSSGNPVFFKAHSEPVTNDEQYTVQIIVNGSGSGAGSMVVNGVTESFDVNAGVDSNPSPNNGLTIGGSEIGVSSDSQFISDIRILNRVLTSDEITTWTSDIPTIDTSEFAVIPQWRLDTGDNRLIYTTTSASVESENNDSVGLWKSSVPTIGNIEREFNQVTTDNKPIFRTNILNGRNAVLFDGVDDNLNINNSTSDTLMPEQGGKWTLFIVALNQDSDAGSHILKGTLYFAITGDNYSGAFDVPYGVAHFSSEPPAVVGTSLTNNVEVFCLRRDGTGVTIFNSNGDTDIIASSSEVWTATDMGEPSSGAGFVDWWLDGPVFQIEKYIGAASDADCVSYLKTLENRFRP